MLSQLLADEAIDAATAWLCKQRARHPPNAEIWHVSFHKATLIPIIKQEIASYQYAFSPLQIIEKRDGSKIAMWSARDALVLKMLALVLQPILPCHATCMHIKGNGGSKRAVQITHDRIKSKQYPFVIRTDIKGYYANIDKHQLLEQLAKVVSCPIILNLLRQYLLYSVEQGGNFYTSYKGISRGCALSPLLAGF